VAYSLGEFLQEKNGELESLKEGSLGEMCGSLGISIRDLLKVSGGMGSLEEESSAKEPGNVEFGLMGSLLIPNGFLVLGPKESL
jgi:hypothetical protein